MKSIGMLIGLSVKIKGKTLFLYDGTLYKQIPTTNGIQYEVYGFIDE